MHGWRAIHWSLGNLPGSMLLKKIDSSSPSSYQLSIAPQLGVGLVFPFRIHAVLLNGLIFCGSWAGNLSCFVFMSAITQPRPKDPMSPWSSLSSGFHSLSNPLLQWALSPGGGVWHQCTAFRWVTFSLHLDRFWGSSVFLTKRQLILMNTNSSQWL